jgi:hypothetical protein
VAKIKRSPKQIEISFTPDEFLSTAVPQLPGFTGGMVIRQIVMDKFAIKNDEICQAVTQFVDGHFIVTLEKGARNAEAMQFLQPERVDQTH